jgi:hypothetical protein
MKHKGIAIGGGFKINGDGKKVVERIPGYGLDASRKAQQRRSKKSRPTRRLPDGSA